ncbi:MAG: carboxynorspermidine decarboxylase [Promethearchaeota archaeon CR_4]|nr:MAG: carboxynorspermidine decarboxylase [Candidatus Lokiarchaeota archaeon CR_4]
MDDDRIRPLLASDIPSPAYIVDELSLEHNLQILDQVQRQTGCKILLALKGFAMFNTFPLIRQYLAGVCASGLFEARLGREEFGKEVHVFAPAYGESEFKQILPLADHIVFNSIAQWNLFRPFVQKAKNKVSCGIRINPEYSEIEVQLYNPCVKYSRFGVKAGEFSHIPEGIEGLHFHTMCEQNSDVLERTLAVVEKKFEKFLSQVKWVNFGGGHHITREDYDVNRLCRLITDFKKKYSVNVYLEPGEAVALNAGILVATVLDIVHNDMDIAILDTSAEAHMPDVLAMPYRPEILGAGKPNEFQHTYRLAGSTCLAGDVVGDYSFPAPLNRGSKLAFLDMAHYSMVKNTTFNGIPLPTIVLYTKDNQLKVVRKFGYEDYKNRLS